MQDNNRKEGNRPRRKLRLSDIQSFLFWPVVILMLLMFILICSYILYRLYQALSLIQINLPTADGTDSSSYDSLVSSLVSQQGHTLAIVAIAAAWISIVIAMIGIYQSKRLEHSNRIVEKNIAESEHYRIAVSNILSLLELKLFNDQYTFGASSIMLAELQRSVTEDELEQSVALSLAELSNYEATLDSCKNEEEFITAYKGMHNAANHILQIKPASPAIMHFAYIKAIFSYYRIARINEPLNPKYAKEYIDSCYELSCKLDDMWRQLKKDYAELDDPYGHMANLKGLVYLWYVRINQDLSLKKQKKLMDDAKESFEKAIQCGKRRNISKDELIKFQNHKIVALLNLLFITKKQKENIDNILSQIDSTFKEKEIEVSLNSYPKFAVNKAHYLYYKYNEINNKNDNDGEIMLELEKVFNILKQFIEKKATIVNVYYWYAKVGQILHKDDLDIKRAVLLAVYYQAINRGTFNTFDKTIQKNFLKLLSDNIGEMDDAIKSLINNKKDILCHATQETQEALKLIFHECPEWNK